MTSIPEDIMYAAGAVVADITGDAAILTMGEVDAMAKHIAQALLAERMKERERCAQIARDDEELPGDSPQEWYDLIWRLGPVENARSACRATKKSIVSAILNNKGEER